jgi:hypothetical protein
MTILNRFMCEVLPNVDVLGPFPSADDAVALFDTRIAVFKDWRVSRKLETHVPDKRTKVDDVHCRSGCCVILLLGCRQRYRLLQLHLPVDRSSVEAVDGAGC